MNKQTEKLISADGVLSWINGVLIETDSEPIRHILSSLKDGLENGKFDSDPIPLPTLKPGDKVKHSNILEPVTVVWTGKEMAVIQDYLGNNYDAFIQDLEPIKEG